MLGHGGEIVPSHGDTTSVIIKIAYNTDDRPEAAFKAKITAINAEDLADDILLLQVHFSSFLSNPGWDCTDEQHFQITLLYHRLKAIFPLFEDVQYLCDSDIDALVEEATSILALDSVIFLESDNAEDLATQLREYTIRVKRSQEAEVWPLIQSVEVFVKSELLCHNVVVYDTPGFGGEEDLTWLIAMRTLGNVDACFFVTSTDDKRMDVNVRQ